MTGGRTTAILAGLAAAAFAAGAAALFLGGGQEPLTRVPADPGRGALPDPEAPEKPPVRPPVRPPVTGPREPRPPLFPPEDDGPPKTEVRTVPPDWKPWARLRFVDAATRAEIPFGRGRVAVVLPRGETPILVPQPWRAAADGRVEIFPSENRTGLPFGVE